jgi:hypothetical protein
MADELRKPDLLEKAFAAQKRVEEFAELLNELPHGDRICELFGKCDCGRDAVIQRAKVIFEIALVTSLMDDFGENHARQ